MPTEERLRRQKITERHRLESQATLTQAIKAASRWPILQSVSTQRSEVKWLTSEGSPPIRLRFGSDPPAAMDSNRVQQALISLEDRFRELRDLGQKRLQVQETTISDLRNELSGAIAAEMEAAKQLQELRNKYNQSVEGLHNEYEHKIKDLSDQLTRKSTEVETLRVRCEIFAQRARQAELLKQRLEDLQGALKEKTREEEQMLEIISSLSERSKSLKSEIQAETQKRSQAHSVLAGSFTLLRRYASLNSRLMQALSGSK